MQKFLDQIEVDNEDEAELTRKIEECKVLNELNAGEDAISRQESEKAILSPQEKEGEGSTEITVPPPLRLLMQPSVRFSRRRRPYRLLTPT